MPRRFQKSGLGRAFATKHPSTFAADKKAAKRRVEFSEVEAFGNWLKDFRRDNNFQPLDMARLLHVDVEK